VDFDLAQVRAFLAVCEHLHFGRAAAVLHLTQQALSKRIHRLEQVLGEQLLVRGHRGVELTAAGQRFLPHAQHLITAAHAATADTRRTGRPVRVDVWGQLQPPLTRIGEVTEQAPGQSVEISMRRSLPAAIEALLRGELDLAFGRVQDIGSPWPDQLAHRLIDLSPGYAFMSTRSPLATEPTLRPADLATATLWAIHTGTSPEVAAYWRHLAGRFGIPIDSTGNNLGLTQSLTVLANRPDLVAVTSGPQSPTDRVPHPDVIAIPLTSPTPRFPWSMVWRRDDRNHALAELLDRLVKLSTRYGWTAFDPDNDWLPEPDLAGLPAAKD
jgi:DNA-binding transcriptional LysR family regulator